jgi:hypothetical protein
LRATDEKMIVIPWPIPGWFLEIKIHIDATATRVHGMVRIRTVNSIAVLSSIRAVFK